MNKNIFTHQEGQIKLFLYNKISLTYAFIDHPVSLITLMVDEVGDDVTLKWQSGTNLLRQSGGVCGTLSGVCTGLCLGSGHWACFPQGSRVSKLFLWFALMSESCCMCYFYIYAHFCVVYSVEIFIISHRFYASGILHNVLKSNQLIKWIVTDDLCPKIEMKKLFQLDEVGS